MNDDNQTVDQVDDHQEEQAEQAEQTESISTPKPVIRPRGTREIKDIRFRPEQVGKDVIEKIYKWYNDGIKLAIILRKVNPGRAEKQALSLIDIYAIINVGLLDKKIKQRTQPKEELSVSQFVFIYEAWKSGLSADSIRRHISGKFWYSKNFFNAVIKSLNTRYKFECGENTLTAISTQAAKIKNPADSSAVEILEFGSRRLGIFNGETEDVICIKIIDIPTSVIERFRLLCKDLGNKFFPVENSPVVFTAEPVSEELKAINTESVAVNTAPQDQVSATETTEQASFGLSIGSYRADEPLEESIDTDDNDQDDDFDPQDFL